MSNQLRVSIENDLVLTDARLNHIDTSNILADANTTNVPNPYVFTVTGWAIFWSQIQSGRSVYLDDVFIGEIEAGKMVIIPVKEGQKILTKYSGNNNGLYSMKVYGVKR